MIIHKDVKIELAASSDQTRAAICEPYFSIDAETGKASLVATDGRMMAIIPVEHSAEHDVAGYVPADALKASRKLANKKNPLSQIKLNGTAALDNGAQYPRHGNTGAKVPYNYPNWKQVVPAADRPVAFKVRLNAEMLYRLAQSIGCEAVELTFAPHLEKPAKHGTGLAPVAQPILVTPITWNPKGGINSDAQTPPAPLAKGILMPIGFD